MTPPRTRLAPTPSGSLHVGNAYSFLLAWLWARTRGGQVVLRIEDVDTTRARPDWIEGIFRDLQWLGLDWDEGPSGPSETAGPWFQSSASRQERYREVLQGWIASGEAYPCRCTRRDLSTDAPQVARLRDPDLPAHPYPGRCRNRTPTEAVASDAWRLRLPDRPSDVSDLLRRTHRLERLSDLGDPVLRRADGCFAYHLAVCVDDADQRIDTVIRGRDLSPWSHLHVHLHRLLGNRPPAFAHHPLLGGPGGERLAKRIGSTSLAAWREGGFRAEDLIGRFVPLLHPGLHAGTGPISARELSRLPPPSPVMTDSVIDIPEIP